MNKYEILQEELRQELENLHGIGDENNRDLSVKPQEFNPFDNEEIEEEDCLADEQS